MPLKKKCPLPSVQKIMAHACNCFESFVPETRVHFAKGPERRAERGSVTAGRSVVCPIDAYYCCCLRSVAKTAALCPLFFICHFVYCYLAHPSPLPTTNRIVYTWYIFVFIARRLRPFPFRVDSRRIAPACAFSSGVPFFFFCEYFRGEIS